MSDILLNTSTAEEAHQRLKEIEIMIRDSNYMQAEDALRQFTTPPHFAKDVYARALLNVAEIRWRMGKGTEAVDIVEKALPYAEEFGDERLQSRAYTILGIATKNIGDYSRSLQYYQRAVAIDEQSGFERGLSMNQNNIGSVYFVMKDYPRAIEYFLQSIQTNERINNLAGLVLAHGNLADVYIQTNQPVVAFEYALRSLSLDEQLGNTSRLYMHYSTLGLIAHQLKEYHKAHEYFTMAISESEAIPNYAASSNDYGNLGQLYSDNNSPFFNYDKAEEYYLKAITLAKENNVKNVECAVANFCAKMYAEQERWQDAFMYQRLYIDLERDLNNSEVRKYSELFDFRYKMQESEKQRAIEKAKHDATEQLLHNVLPPSIARKILAGKTLVAERLENVSILFADIVNFTSLSEKISPDALIASLDKIFSSFDEIAEKYGAEKIKTIGDSYMVVAGAPESTQQHAHEIVQVGFDMLDVMKQFDSVVGEEIQIRIGIHCGEVVAGVIGKKKFAYDLWGDAVNTASRMESHGEAGKIHVSEEFVTALTLNRPSDTFSQWEKEGMRAIPRGEKEIKGKGMMRTYFLEKA
ncbi:MAG: adenylate/guanylate cyclase domain-containing protein [Candidatus Kapaibacterium sp.]|nr:tetratricopeptide repeat protein [Bacteroidota bacterium]